MNAPCFPNTLDSLQLSELTVDLAEERSTAHIATERLEAETAERLKLEKELGDQANKVKNLQETTEKLEMELICAKSDLNGISEDEDAENEDGGGGVYKLKYERVARELEFTKRRLHTQHEHDLEQLVGLKKQLEKKVGWKDHRRYPNLTYHSSQRSFRMPTKKLRSNVRLWANGSARHRR